MRRLQLPIFLFLYLLSPKAITDEENPKSSVDNLKDYPDYLGYSKV